jgi:phosphohistidine phosphatase
MRHLTLIRHAKSSWGDTSLPDRLRPLNRRGKRDAPRMGERLARGGFEADVLLCSPATRALATAEIIAPEIGYPLDEILVEGRLYGAGLHELIDVVADLDDSHASAILIGHNPGMSELVDMISPNLAGSLPTCGIVQFEFSEDSWARVLDAEPAEASFDSPRIAGLR